MNDESYKCGSCGKDLRLHTKEELKKCIPDMDVKVKEIENWVIEAERNIKEMRDLIKAVLDNSDKENPLYPIASELHEECSKLDSRLSEYRPGKFTFDDCMDAIKEYDELGEKLKELYESYKKHNER